MSNTARQPAIYLSHGGGPCFWMEYPKPFGPHTFAGLRQYLANLLGNLPERPKTIVVISAHWEAKLPTVSTAAAPSMLFDYYGFPEHTYQLRYPAPGAPEIAVEVQALLRQADIASATDKTRGFDHGVFVPFLIIDPAAEIPVVMLSLQHNLDPAQHIAIGKALTPLRDQGVLIIRSGNSYHNLRKFADDDSRAAAAFDEWLNDTTTAPDATARNNGLINWQSAPYARECHPREEHLLPLMVVAGAAGEARGRRTFSGAIGGKAVSCFAFG